MATPLHGSPPFAGAGFVQPRMRFWKPSPHVFEQGDHADHADQADQLPFTNQDSQDKTKILLRPNQSSVTNNKSMKIQ